MKGVIDQITAKLLKSDVITNNWVLVALLFAPEYTKWTVKELIVIAPWVFGMGIVSNIILMFQKNGERIVNGVVEIKKAKNGGASAPQS